MNLNPMNLFGRKNGNRDGQVGTATREAMPMGPWSGMLGGWVPRQANPHLFEHLREAVPIIDSGLNRLVAMDGLIGVAGGNDALVGEVNEWMRSVPVNDNELGFQAFYASQGGEMYEQGFGVAEMILGARGRDVVGLRVADSKGVVYVRAENRLRTFYRPPTPPSVTRPDGLETVESLLRGGVRRASVESVIGLGFVELTPDNLVTGVHNPEADNPYGTSVLRSLPFVTQILLKVENALGRSWERFGDPIFHVSYATKNRQLSADELNKRAVNILKQLALAMAAKARGQSVDISTGIGAQDEVKIEVVGANGQVLELKEPVAHLLQQVTSTFGLPPWMLGVQGQAVQGQSEQQAVLVLQDAQTRFARRRPGLERVVATMLRSRGRTWKPGDWELTQTLPNLMDEAKRAQADFLRAQTALMLNQSGQAEVEPGQGIDNGLRSALRDFLSKAAETGELPEITPALAEQFRRFGL